jgi:hypothetical protein
MTFSLMLGTLGEQMLLKQKLEASKKPEFKPVDMFVAWPGSPYDGLRASVMSKEGAEYVVKFQGGMVTSILASYLVAAPETKESTEKTNKVVPDDKPDTRGNALQDEEKTERAKKMSTEIEKPPIMEHMKKGPKAIDLENAKTAPEASAGLKTLIEAAEAAEAAVKSVKDEAAAVAKKLGEAKVKEASAIKAIVDDMEKNEEVVVKIGDRLVALDQSKNKAAVNIPKTGALRTRYDHALEMLKNLQNAAAEQAKAVKALEAEAEEQYGGTYNVEKRVSIFPASLRAALGVVAGFADIVKGIVNWVKSLFDVAKDAEKAVIDFEKEYTESAKTAAKEGKEAEAAAKKTKASREWLDRVAPLLAKKMLKSSKVLADFLEKEVIESPGIEVTTAGDDRLYFPDKAIDYAAGEIPQDFVDDEIVKSRKIEGWFGRYGVPGAYDATPWTFAEDEESLLKKLDAVFGAEPDEIEMAVSAKVEAAKVKYTGDIDADFEATDVDVVADVVAANKVPLTLKEGAAEDAVRVKALAKHLADRARQIYKNNKTWGMKMARAEAGSSGARDQLYMWMEHWAGSWISNGYMDTDQKRIEKFGNPAEMQPASRVVAQDTSANEAEPLKVREVKSGPNGPLTPGDPYTEIPAGNGGTPEKQPEQGKEPVITEDKPKEPSGPEGTKPVEETPEEAGEK